VRARSLRLVEDRSLSADIELVAESVRSGAIVAAAESRVGPLASRTSSSRSCAAT